MLIFESTNKLNTSQMATLAAHIQTTNMKLIGWYKDAKIDFGVIGSATARIDGNKFVIDYIEDGVKKTWSMRFWTEERYDFDYFYNVWMEEG